MVGVMCISVIGFMSMFEVGWYYDGCFNLLDLVCMIEIE